MAKVLEMVFRNAGGRETVLRLSNPKDDIKLSEVTPVMNDIVSKNIFEPKGGALLQVVEARLRTQDTVQLA